MSEPQNLQEYHQRCRENNTISGQGSDNVRCHVPCPFCGAPDFMIFGILEIGAVGAKGATCSECGRSAKILTHGTQPGSIRCEMVQTGGADQPEWLIPKLRVLA
jgi:hypothetical protein